MKRTQRQSPHWVAHVAGAATVLLVLTWPRRAWAQWVQWAAGIDADAVVADTRDRSFGAGVDGRFGFRFGLPRGAFIDRTLIGAMIFQIEAIGGYRVLPVSGPRRGELEVGSFGGGVRIGVEETGWEPFVFGHVSAAVDADRVEPLWDVGAAADYRFPAASLGVHGSFHALSGAGGWIEVGPHFEFRWM